MENLRAEFREDPPATAREAEAKTTANGNSNSNGNGNGNGNGGAGSARSVSTLLYCTVLYFGAGYARSPHACGSGSWVLLDRALLADAARCCSSGDECLGATYLQLVCDV